MTWYTRLLGLFSRHTPALPGPGPEIARADARPEVRHDSVYNSLTGLGGSFDKGAVGRPNPYVQPLSVDELRLLYEHNGISRRIIDIIPGRACRRGWSVPEIGNEDTRLQTWSRVQEAMSMARLYGGSVMLLVTEDDVPAGFRGDPRAWLRQPLDLERIGKLHALQVFDATEAWPSAWDRDPRSIGFRLPSEWVLTADGFQAWVHASRLVYVRGTRRTTGQLRYGSATRMPDASALQAMWDEIRRLTETLQGGAVLAQEIRESVLKVANLGARGTGDEASELEQRIGLLARTKSVLGMILLGEGDSYENRSNPPTGFDQLSAAGWEALAAVTGIPQVILMGSTPGGLNTDGESSWEGFRQLVSSYQEDHRPGLERLYQVVYAQQDGPTGGQAPEGWSLTFASLDEPNEAKLAETRRTVAETDATYIERGVYTAADVARSRFGASGWSIEMLPVTPPEPKAADAGASPFASVGLPALVQAKIVGHSAARRLLGVQETEAPTPAELALLAGPVESDPAAAPRTDAADGVCVMVPAADPGLRAQVEALLGQALVPETQPHVTVLYLGPVAPEQLAEVAAVVAEEAAAGPVHPIGRAHVATFPAGPDGTPVVLELGDAWDLGALHERLLRRLAHLVSARQHRRYRPHLTLGYALEPVSVEAATALLQLDLGDLAVPVLQLEVRGPGGELVATVAVGG